MKYKFFLTSLIVTGLMRPTLAETFPADGYMLEDKTYKNAATYTNTGVYDGSVTATAEYTDNIYKIAAGMYLPQNSEAAAPCTAGYFCTGMTDAMYSESGDQGITACPDGYPNSAVGAGAQTQCYTACTVATANIAHATGVSGNDYYGDGTDTCVATECELGYHTNDELQIVNKTPVIPVDYTVGGDAAAYVDASGTAKYWLCEGDGCSGATSADFGEVLTEPNTWATRFDYGTVYGRASCQPTINPGLEYFDYNGELLMFGEMTYEDFESGLAAIIGDGKAAYATNVLREYMSAMEGGDEAEMLAAEESLSQVQVLLLGTEPDANYSTDSEGQHCYCQTTGYTPTGGNFVEATAASWVRYPSYFQSAASCASGCADSCALDLWFNDVSRRIFRAAVFGSLGFESGGTCDANDITINWTDAEEIGDAGMCKYGGDIKTPVKAVTKKGKTFKGWRFEKTN